MAVQGTMTSWLSLNLGYIHYVNCKGVEDIFYGVILSSYPPHHTEYFDTPPPSPSPKNQKKKVTTPSLDWKESKIWAM